ncbi:MAG: Peptidoglycan-binding lysin domain protein [Herbinix sp.]|jgi:spore germination protein|nr:Peptidoglycan-binding lysin domain protein [Herbinix sp.]
MRIHTVQPDETIYTIAEDYQIPVERLLKDNNLPPNYRLNDGQSLIITYPEKTYLVQDGDTLQSIADANEISVKQLLRNNPHLSDRDYLYIGEEIVLSYPQQQDIKVIGYAFSYIHKNILIKSLPFLTYLTIINYRVLADGSILSVNDTEVLELAKEYGVAPIMMLSSIDEQGRSSYGVNHTLLNNYEARSLLIGNVLNILNEKGFIGIDIGFQAILPEDIPVYIEFIRIMTYSLNQEGYEVFVTLVPSTFGYISGIQNDIPYFSQIGEIANHVILISYQWATAFIPTVAQTTVNFLRDYLNYVLTQIPPEKIFIGLTRLAYDWELPYIEGETTGRGNVLTNADALTLANQTNAEINYDDKTQTPYFHYNITGVDHFVWFKDARSVNAIISLVNEYNLEGIAIWNIMYYAPQTWLVLNSQYNIISENNEAI